MWTRLVINKYEVQSPIYALYKFSRLYLRVKRMFLSVGLKVEAMKRLRIARVPMSSLQPGQWRYLLPHERF